MVWEGKDVIKYGRAMIGATNPLASAPGTIRGDFGVWVPALLVLLPLVPWARPNRLPGSGACTWGSLLGGGACLSYGQVTLLPVIAMLPHAGVDVGRNIIHGSDSVESAQREIALWFSAGELAQWKPVATPWVYE